LSDFDGSGTTSAMSSSMMLPNPWQVGQAPSGVFGETAAGVTLGALRAAVAAGEVGADDRVVLLVTGDGLKTPGAVAFTYQPIEIEADVDAVLERLQAAAA
jgi:threonine synthase